MSARLKKRDSPSSLAFSPLAVELLEKQIQESSSPVKVQFLSMIKCKTNGKDQLAILRQIGYILKEKGGLRGKDDISFLCAMFIYCVSRHPMRRSLSSILETTIDEGRSLVLSSFSQILSVHLQFDETPQQCDIRRRIDTIGALMENFPTGDEVIRENSRQVLNYMTEALETLFLSVRIERNPLLQTQLMQHMLTALKNIVASLQKCQNLFHHMANEASTEASKNYLLCNERLMKISLEIIYDEYIILDCRSAAGMLFPAIFLQLSPDYIDMFIDAVYNGFKGTPTSHPDINGLPKVLFDSICKFFNLKPSLSGILVFLHGLLVKLPDNILHKDMIFNEPSSIFIDLFIDNLIKVSLQGTHKSILVLSIKTISFWIEKANFIPMNVAQTRSVVVKMVSHKILPHLILYVDHHIDTIRHNANAAIKNCFLLLASAGDDLADKFASEYFSGALNTRGRIAMLINLCEFISIQHVLDMRKELPNNIISLLHDVDLASHSCDLYRVMCKKHIKEITELRTDVNHWIKSWVNNLYSKLSGNNNEVKANIVNFIIPSLLKIHPNIVTHVLSDMHSIPCGEKVRAAIVFLKCLRGMKNFSSTMSFTSVAYESSNIGGKMWKNIIQIEDMQRCLTHIDDQIRLDALSLICSSVKTTDPIDNDDIKLFAYFLEFNMNNENSSFRQQLITNFKKFALRMFSHSFQQTKLLSTMDSNDVNCIPAIYGAFLVWLTRFIFQKMYFSAPYSQMSTSLEILLVLTEILHDNGNSELLNHYHIKPDEKDEFTTILIECFKDTYDPNRAIVIEIFRRCPSFCSSSNTDLHKLYDEAIVNLSSPKPDVSAVAAYYMSFLALVMNKELSSILYDKLEDKHYLYFEDCKENISELVLFDMHIVLLHKQLAITKSNLINGCQDAPLYPVLYSIRMLFQLKINNFDGICIANEKCFSVFLNDLIEIGLDIIKIVSPYVSNDAPEGYLCDVSLLEIFEVLNLNEDDQRNIELEAQLARMLLVCCWRSMKEVSLLIGIIVSHFSNTKNQSIKLNLLPVSTFLKLWNMFCDILLRSKHAGAYELASLGFIKLCSVLWCSDDSELRSIPEKAVTTLVNDLLDSTPFDNAQVTRRSAGLPFYLEALCITEPLIKDKHSFRYLMMSLTNLCRSRMIKHDVNKLVISLNILRAFYKNTKLREDVYPYVSSGVIISIQGFSSSCWAIRNSCTLLFGALMQRIFGVKKSKMTGREFFSKFPELYSFLLDQAKSMIYDSVGTSKIVCAAYNPSLYPLLLLLSHLYPSTIEGTNALMQLDEFIPCVMRCGSNAVYKTRTMAAKALVPLLALDKIESFLLKLLEYIPQEDSKHFDQNGIHGSLLQLKFICHRCFSGPKHVVSLVSVFEKFTSIYHICLKTDISFIIKSLYIEISMLFVQNGYTDLSYSVLPLCLHYLHLSIGEKPISISLPGFALFLRNSAQYIQMLIRYTKDISSLKEHIIEGIRCTSETLVDIYDVVILFSKSNDRDVCLHMFELIESINKDHKMPRKVCDMLLKFIDRFSSEQPCFAKALSVFGSVIRLEYEDYTEDLIKILDKHVSSSKLHSDQLRTAIVKVSIIFVRKFEDNSDLKISNKAKDTLTKAWKYIEESSQSDQCEASRAETVSILCIYYEDSKVFSHCPDLVYRYFNCCINLLKDSCAHIRESAARNLYSALNDSSCQGDRFYVPQNSVVIRDLFSKLLIRKIQEDARRSSAYLFSLILEIDLFDFFDWANERTKSERNEHDTDFEENQLLERFVVYEKSKENPYYDCVDICQRALDVLENFYGHCKLSERESCMTILNLITNYCQLNRSSRTNHGWTFIEKFKKIFCKFEYLK